MIDYANNCMSITYVTLHLICRLYGLLSSLIKLERHRIINLSVLNKANRIDMEGVGADGMQTSDGLWNSEAVDALKIAVSSLPIIITTANYVFCMNLIEYWCN